MRAYFFRVGVQVRHLAGTIRYICQLDSMTPIYIYIHIYIYIYICVYMYMQAEKTIKHALSPRAIITHFPEHA